MTVGSGMVVWGGGDAGDSVVGRGRSSSRARSAAVQTIATSVAGALASSRPWRVLQCFQDRPELVGVVREIDQRRVQDDVEIDGPVAVHDPIPKLSRSRPVDVRVSVPESVVSRPAASPRTVKFHRSASRRCRSPVSAATSHPVTSRCASSAASIISARMRISRCVIEELCLGEDVLPESRMDGSAGDQIHGSTQDVAEF